MTEIKFCGLKTGRDVAAAEQAGARWTGYVFFEKSPRHVSPSLAGELAHLARSSETVAVTVNPDDDLLARAFAMPCIPTGSSCTATRRLSVSSRHGAMQNGALSRPCRLQMPAISTP